MTTRDAASDWWPSASLDTLKASAELRTAIRQWMKHSSILEVSTPPLSWAANTDPQVQSITVDAAAGSVRGRYLHTSPEFAMKRLLCAYPSTDIYQLATVFRAEEQGRFHASQFDMLEWYRVGMTHTDLMDDVAGLLKHVWAGFAIDFPAIQIISYCEAVFNRFGNWPDELHGSTIRDYFLQHGRSFPAGLESDHSASLDLFVDEFLVAEFPDTVITFLTDYPASQAALARIAVNSAGVMVAQRFEVFAGRIELANGFHELADASVQRQRFELDLHNRSVMGQSPVPIDEHLLAALSHGLPDCSGVALGLDRLHMVLGAHNHINEVKSFCDDNA